MSMRARRRRATTQDHVTYGLSAHIIGALAILQGSACAAALNTPPLTGPLVANPNPFSFDAGALGPIYVTGVASGLGFWQNNPAPGDRDWRLDLSNGQIFVQKANDWWQYFVDVGIYSQPALGSAYVSAGDAVRDTFGLVPQAYLKIVPNENFSVEAGKLPTQIGNENSLTFQNVNIERGLLWNQTPSFTRGIQTNYTNGSFSLSVSWNDGYYSNRLNWISGTASYSLNNGVDTILVIGGANLGHTGYASLANPLAENNSRIFDFGYTHQTGPWMINPYLQFSTVPENAELGFDHDASTFSGAVLLSYSVSSQFSLAGRVELIATSGSNVIGTPNLLYGPGSDAWSLTFTPTFQRGVFFTRGEASYVSAGNTTAGDTFGAYGNDRSQARLMLETGAMF